MIRTGSFQNWIFRNVSLSAGGRRDFSIYLWKFETVGDWIFSEQKVFLPNYMSFALQDGRIELEAPRI